MNEYDFHIGAEIDCIDGRWGRLVKVALEPEAWCVTHLIVQSGMLIKEAHVVPIEFVDSATEKVINLSLTISELQQHPLYKEKQYEVPIENGQYGRYGHSDIVLNAQGSIATAHVPMQKVTIHEGVAQNLALLQKGTPIRNATGEIGKLDDVITSSETNEVTHLVMHQGFLFPDHLVIPIQLVTEIGGEGIFTEATKEVLKGLITPSPEADTTMSAEESPLMPISSTEIGNGLTADAIVANRITKALHNHPVTADAVIEVVNEGGLVTLIGTVPDVKTQQTAAKVAANQDSVVKVVNELVIKAPTYA
jgi:uncharacterized protein YrrD